MSWCLKCQAQNSNEATICAACGTPIPPTLATGAALGRWWRALAAWKYVVGVLTIALVVGVVILQKERRQEPSGDDTGTRNRMRIAGRIREQVTALHSAYISRDTVLVITGVCDETEIAAIEDRRVMQLLVENGFTSVECGSRTISVR